MHCECGSPLEAGSIWIQGADTHLQEYVTVIIAKAAKTEEGSLDRDVRYLCVRRARGETRHRCQRELDNETVGPREGRAQSKGLCVSVSERQWAHEHCLSLLE